MSEDSKTLTLKDAAVNDTWHRYYNGPNAGTIDVDTARREMPWLIGESRGVTLPCSEKTDE